MLYSTRWELVSVEGMTQIPITDKKAFVGFYPGKINTIKGNTGCNSLSGSFELTGNHTIKFSPLTTTKMACTERNAEAQLVAALGKTNTWSIAANELLLSDGTKVMAKFIASAAENSTSETEKLTGRWELNYISGSRIAFNGLYPKEKPFIVFKIPANEISGSTGCNGFSSKINITGNKISIGDPLKTMIFCDGGGENAFIEMLKKVNSYSVTDDGTILNFVAGDVAVMRFSKKENN